MKKILSASFLFGIAGLVSCQTPATDRTGEKNNPNESKKPMETSYHKTDAEWKKILTPEQYEVLREKGTERPGTGEYNKHFEKGVYVCAGCGTELFTSDQKFDSHCGW